MVPVWLHWLSILVIVEGVISAALLAVAVVRRPQHMWIMNLVWPLTGLYGGLAALWLYRRHGGRDSERPFPASVALAACHCGSGCTLGDLIAETLAFVFPGVVIWFGWQSLFGEKMFAVWVLDYVLAFVLGIAFQYFTIAPMQKLSPGEGLVAAVKADTASLTAWQVGMYGFMAFAQFYLFRHLFGVRLRPDMPEFWFMMQIAMLAGFATSYPVNWWLIKAGIKEKM